MKKFKTKIKHTIVEGIVHYIKNSVELGWEDLDDKLIMAGINEVRLIMERKMLQPQAEYSFTFSPVQSLALSLWFTDFIEPVQKNLQNLQITNKLHTISNQIKQLYA
jgi:hypothetical protein